MGKVDFPAEYAGVAGVGEPARCTLSSGCGGRTLTVAARRTGEYPARPVWDVPACPVWLCGVMMLACVAATLVFAALEFAAACKGLYSLKRRGRREE